MTPRRYLIVNADDFGQSAGVNRGIIQAHEQGVVTSASLMVRWPAAAEAAAYSRERPRLSLGLHLDLGEWAYRDGAWVPLYRVVPADDGQAVSDEVSRQLSEFRRLAGKDPTHIDSHQHVHLREPVRSVLLEIARTGGVPLRHVSPEVSYCGEFYGQTAEGSPIPGRITADELIRILAALSPGFTELGCHPGTAIDLDTMYLTEREEEVKVLCDPRVRKAVIALGIELCSFSDVRANPAGCRL
jgi:predicted glycoside hydrolase/deacetylase ChbG (UPF0249 family)